MKNDPQTTRRARRETAIEDAVMAHPERLGYPGAAAIRNCRVAMVAGRVDVLLLPAKSRVKVVLVETKVATAPDAASKVIGQLLMYYAGALCLGSVGIRYLREFACREPERARCTSWVSPKSITCGVSPPGDAWKLLSQGTLLKPYQVRLFIALEGVAHRALVPTLQILRKHHGLAIGVIRTKDGRIAAVENR
ncbi:MAG: hypothetical protein WD847_02530 [Pirellulales bacterium]